MALPSPKEIEKLQQFQTRIKDLKLRGEQNTDRFLLRWIRAKSTVDESEQMLRKSLKWRKENRIDEIESWEPPEMLRKPLELVDMDGVDKDNNPVIIYAMRTWPLQQVVDLGLDQPLLKTFVLIVERVNKKMQGKYTNDGQPVDQFVAIRDWDQVPLNPRVLNLLSKAAQVISDNYPNQLKTLYVINARASYFFILKYMTPLCRGYFKLSEEWCVYGYNSEEWQKALKQQIAEDQLPKALGGRRNCVYITKS